MTRPPECRACRRIVKPGMLACRDHWMMLPVALRNSINAAYRAKGRDRKAARDYLDYISAADAFWKHKGVWLPGIPGDVPTRDVMKMRGDL